MQVCRPLSLWKRYIIGATKNIQKHTHTVNSNTAPVPHFIILGLSLLVQPSSVFPQHHPPAHVVKMNMINSNAVMYILS